MIYSKPQIVRTFKAVNMIQGTKGVMGLKDSNSGNYTQTLGAYEADE